MATAILDDVRSAKLYIERAEKDLTADGMIGLNIDLLRAMMIMDERYKEYCLLDDDRNGVEDGTTYNEEFGPNMEFYIEADDWHEISKGLRQWKAQNKDWPELLDFDTADMIDI